MSESDEFPVADIRSLARSYGRLSIELRTNDAKHTASIHDIDKRVQRVEDQVASASQQILARLDDISRQIQPDTHPLNIAPANTGPHPTADEQSARVDLLRKTSQVLGGLLALMAAAATWLAVHGAR